MKLVFIVLGIVGVSNQAWSWGDRGHHVVAYTAARLMTHKSGVSDPSFFKMMREKALMLAYLSNIPDRSWRNSGRPIAKKFNYPTHFIDIEVIAGTLGAKSLFKMIRSLPMNYKDLEKQYEGKPLTFGGKVSAKKKIELNKDLGSNPWRIMDLYKGMIKALKCYGSKGSPKKFSEGKITHLGSFVPTAHKNVVTYVCSKQTTAYEEIRNSLIMGGLMSHFVGDLSQPYHVTSNYDGWQTGNGGIHRFFETDVVNALGEDLNELVLKKAQAYLDKGVGFSMTKTLNSDERVFQLILGLMSDSYKKLQIVQKLDDGVAIVRKSSVLEWGEISRTKKGAQRKPASVLNVKHAFEKLVVERLALAAAVLHKVWRAAWVQAGRPSVRSIEGYKIPFPTDVPFIKPSYVQSPLPQL